MEVDSFLIFDSITGIIQFTNIMKKKLQGNLAMIYKGNA